MMPLHYTLLFATALAVINLWLAIRSGRVRFQSKIPMGDGGQPALLARMRAQANFGEYVPLALILFGLIELRVGASPSLFAIGALLVVSRLLHPLGLERPAPNWLRAAGILGTLIASVALIVWAITLLYAPVAAPTVSYF